MFESIGRRRRPTLQRRAGTLLFTLGQCSMLGGSLLALDAQAPQALELATEAVLVELVPMTPPPGGGLGLPRLPAVPAPAPLPQAAVTPPPEAAPLSMVPAPSPAPASMAPAPADLGPTGGGGPPGPPGPGLGTGAACPPEEDCTPCPAGTDCSEARPLQVDQLEVRRRVLPQFPTAARGAGLQEASCVLQLTVDVRGRVEEVSVSGCPEVFHPASRQAAARWRFVPLRVDGQAQRATFALTIHYRGDG